MAFVCFCFMVPIMMPYSVELSVMISVACCGCPIYPRVVLIASSSLALYNNAPQSASATDDITLRMMVEMTIIDPFGWVLSSFVPPMYKNLLLCFFLVIQKNTMRHCAL